MSKVVRTRRKKNNVGRKHLKKKTLRGKKTFKGGLAGKYSMRHLASSGMTGAVGSTSSYLNRVKGGSHWREWEDAGFFTATASTNLDVIPHRAVLSPKKAGKGFWESVGYIFFGVPVSGLLGKITPEFKNKVEKTVARLYAARDLVDKLEAQYNNLTSKLKNTRVEEKGDASMPDFSPIGGQGEYRQGRF